MVDIKQLRILRKVRKEFNYKDYVEDNYLVKYTASNELRICCPKCDDYKFKLYVNDDKKKFNCFKCGFSSGNHDVFDFVSVTEGLDRGKVILRLAHEYADVASSWEEILKACKPIEVEENEPSDPGKIKVVQFPDGVYPLTTLENEVEKPFWDYLINQRGLLESEVKAIKTHYVPDECIIYDERGRIRGDIKNRILIPVYGGDHELVSWISRSINGAQPKYFNCPDSESHRTLWPFISPRNTRIVLVEGILDAVAVRRLGLDAYATFGKKLSYDQIALLKSWGVTSIILFWDFEAKKEMVKELDKLKLQFNSLFVVSFNDWFLDKDAGDTLRKEEDRELMAQMLSEPNLIEVDSWEYIKWKIL